MFSRSVATLLMLKYNELVPDRKDPRAQGVGP